MYDHLGLKVKDVAASVRFYTAALAPLGHALASSDASGAGFGPPGEPALWLYADASAQTGMHVALRALDRAAVDRFYAMGLAAGGRDHGKPGLRAKSALSTTRLHYEYLMTLHADMHQRLGTLSVG